MRRSNARLRYPIVEAMEERVLHSADLSPLQLDAPANTDSVLLQTLPAQPSDRVEGAHEIAFIDVAIPEAVQLIDDLQAQRTAGRPIELVTIDAGADGIAVISRTLAGRGEVGALHLLAHGSDGALQLGTARLDAQTLLQRAAELAGWGAALSAEADLLLYGCDVASSRDGEAFVRDLAALTGADVAASVDPTGAAARGGNWSLEVESGTIEASIAVSALQQGLWSGLLATYVADPARADGSTGSLRWAITQANANPGIDTVRLLAGTHRLTLNGIDNTNLAGDLDLAGDIVFVGATANAADTVVQQTLAHRVFDQLSGSAAFSNLTITGGSGGMPGGGLNIAAGASATLSNVVLHSNSGSSGGAIHNAGLLSLGQVTISGNHAAQGGGIYNAGTARLANSTISGNTAVSGAGVFGATAGTLAGANLTISGNSASGSGGGLLVQGNADALTSTTVAGNSAASGGGIWSAAGTTVTLRNSILATNAGGNANQLQASAGYNIDTDGSAVSGGGTDIRTTEAELRLDALASNGGNTSTHALLVGSVAIDAGMSGISTTDQRGAVRSGATDIGAFEATAIVAQDSAIFFNAGSGFPVTVPGAGSDALRLELEVTNGTLDLRQSVGPEFQVNTTTQRDQRTPAIAVAADGHYVVVWASDGQDGSKDGIYARIYNADGSARSGEIAVNTTTNDDQNAPAVAIDGSGRFVVAWQSYDPDKFTYDIYARSFDAGGAAISGQKRITSESGDQVAPAVAMDDAGNVVIVYSGSGNVRGSDREGIYARTSTYTLASIAVETMVNTSTAGVQAAPTVARHAAGHVVAWQSTGQDGSGTSIHAQRYDAGGVRLGGEFRLNLTTVGDQKTPSIAVNASGQFVVAWESASQDGSLLGVVARRFASDGTALTGEVLVNTTTASDQFEPSAVLAEDGRFAVAWTSTGQDHVDGKQGVYLRGFAADGSALGNEIAVNSTTVDVQAAASLGIADDGQMVAVWHSRLQDGNGYGVHGQRFLQPGALSYLVGDGVADLRIVVDGNASDLDRALDTLRYQPSAGFRGAAYLTVRSTDPSSGLVTADYGVPIDVQTVNAAPTVALPLAQVTAEDTALVFSAANGNAIGIADVDADPQPLQLTVSVTNGGLTLATLAGLTIVGGANGMQTVVVQGRLADLNAALDGLSLQPATDYFGSAVLTVIVDDLGHSTVGGPYAASGTVALTITSSNDAPVNLLPAMASVLEGEALIFSANNGNAIRIVDVDVANGNLEVTLTSTMGTLQLSRTNNLSFITGTGRGDENRITFRGTLANINLALDGLRYTPIDNYAGPAFIEISSSDLGGSGAGGAMVDRDVLAIHVVPNANNAAPAIADPGNQLTLEEVPLVFSTATGNPISVLDDADGQPIRVTLTVTNGTLTLGTNTGNEFIVNSTTADDQQAADVAMAPGGGHIVVWQSKNQDGSGQGIYLQRYSDEGLALGLETRVNTSTAGDQTAPAIAIANDGRFVVVWASANGGSPGNGIYAQRYAADGHALGTELRISGPTGSPAAPSVAVDAAGNFVVAWQADDHDGDGSGIQARRVSAEGTLGAAFRVNSTTAKEQIAPVVAMADAGSFVVAWQGVRAGANDWAIYAQRYSAAGIAVGGEFLVNTVNYKDQTTPAIAADAAGNFVVVWQSKDVDYNDGKFGIYGQRYGAAGVPIGPQFLVNTRTPNEQTVPAVAMDSAGSFVVAWQSKNQDSRDDDSGVYAQRFATNGARVGGEFRVNTTLPGAQRAPALAMSDTGKLLVTWTSDRQDGSGEGIYGQRYIDAKSLAFTVGDGTDDSTMTFFGTVEQINDVLDGLIFTPQQDFDGRAELTIVVDDLGNSGAGGPEISSADLRINVVGINDAPVITVPPPQVVVEDTTVVFSSSAAGLISIADPDAGTKKLLVTISTTQGLLTLGRLQGLGFDVGDGTADAAMTFDGNLSALNAALRDMTLALPANYTGAVEVRISASDQGNTGSGGALIDNAVVHLTVVPNAANSPPKVLVPAPQRTPVDTSLAMRTALLNAIRIVDDAGSSPVRVTVTVSQGTVTLDQRTGVPEIANRGVLGDQSEARIAMLPDGSSIVVWTSSLGDGSGSGIYAQRFDPTGARLDGDFRVNTTTASNQWAPAVAADPAAGFAVVWVSDNQDGSGRGIYLQRYDLDGRRIGLETRVNTSISGDQTAPAVTLAGDGSLVVVWQSADASGEGIYMQRYDANGEPAGAETLVNIVTANEQVRAAVGVDAAGRITVVWEGRDADKEGILARRFAVDGSPLGGEFIVNGVTVGSQARPALAVSPAGDWVVAWEGADGNGSGILARRFDSAGDPVGGEFLVNSNTIGNQTAPSVAINASGDLAFAWQSADGSGQGVYSRSFAAGGIGGRELLVNTSTAGDQRTPAVGLRADGNYRVVWTGDRQDADGDGIGMQAMQRAGALVFGSGDGEDDAHIVFTGTLAEANAALDGLVFKPSTGFVGVARITVGVEDLGGSGSGGPMAGSGSVDIVVGSAPLLDLDANGSSGVGGADFRAIFRTGLGPIPIADLDASLTDPNSANLTRLTVTIANLLDGTAERLAANIGGTAIIASYDSASGTLLLSGANSVANYQKVLRTITYSNTAASPSTSARSVTFVAFDGSGNSNVATTTIQFGGANTAPIGANDRYVVNVDQTLVVAPNGVLANDSDAEFDLLTVALVSTTSNGLLTLQPDGAFTYVPNAGFRGVDQFSYMVGDGLLNSGIAQVTISVGSGHIAPAGSGATVTSPEDVALTIERAEFGFSDPGDTPPDAMAAVLISVLPVSGMLLLNGADVTAGDRIDVADIDAGGLVFVPTANWSGNVSIGFRVQDDGGTSNGGVDTDPLVRWLTIEVTPVQDPPLRVGTIGAQSATENLPFSVGFGAGHFVDPDPDDELVYAARLASGAALPGWLAFDAATRIFSGTPTNADTGALAIRVSATDGAGAAAFDEFELTVANVNDAPVLMLPVPALAVPEGLPFSLILAAGTFSDIDAGDSLSYAATLASGAALPDWLRFDAATLSFSGIPANADVGTFTVRITATDLAAATAYADFTLTVTNVNDVPVQVQPLPDRAGVEGLPFSFAVDGASFTDIDAGDVLTYSAGLASGAALPAWLGFDAVSRTFSGTPANVDVGSIRIRVHATDLAAASAYADFTLTVDNVNDAPVLAQPVPDQWATEDVPFSFTLAPGTFDDIDAGDVLAHAATLASGAALPAWLSFDPLTRTFSGTPGNGDVGALTVRITATDSALASVSDDFALTVANVNDVPTLARPIGNRGATLGVPFAFTVPADTFVDIDAGDSLGYAARRASGGALPGWLAFDPASRTFSGTPGLFDLGPVGIRVFATDLAGARADVDFTVTVVAVNTPPVLARPIGDRSAVEDSAFDFTVPGDTFFDLDLFDTLSYEARQTDGSALPAWLSFDAATRRFSGAPANADVGVITVRLTATDNGGASALQDFLISVSNVNDAPVLAQPVPDRSATQGVPFSFTVDAGTFTDLDAGDVLAWSARQASGAALPAWLSFDAATSTFSGTPGNADVGPVTIRVTATDLAAAIAFADFTLTVADANDAPMLARPIADRAATLGVPFTFTVPADSFVDIDAGDSLGYSAQRLSAGALPGWLAFDAATRTFSGTAGMADLGPVAIRITATDRAGASVDADFTIAVQAINTSPLLVRPIADQTAAEDSAFTFTVPANTFFDPNLFDPLSYEARRTDGSALPAWLTFDATTRSFHGTPTNDDVGAITIRVSATGMMGAVASDQFVLTVTNVNDAPERVRPVADQSAVQGMPFGFVVDAATFADIDAGDVLAYTAGLASGAELPAWLRFDAATRSFAGTPGTADVGAIVVRLTASDAAGAAAAADFSISVAKVNQAPRPGAAIEDRSVEAGQQLLLKLPAASFVDPDAGDVLAYRASLIDGSALPGWLIFDAAELSFSGLPARADLGLVTIRVTATDGDGAAAQAVFIIDVTELRAQADVFQPAVDSEPFPLALPPALPLPLPLPLALPLPQAAAANQLFFAPSTAASSGTPGPVLEMAASSGGRAAAQDGALLLGPAGAEFHALELHGKAAAAIETARSGSRSDAILAALPTAQFSELQVSNPSQLLLSEDLLRRFDELHHQMQDLGEQHRRMLASSLAVSSGLSLGYVVWLIRGGVLVSSMLSALPAWQLIDPMPVLASAGAAKSRRSWFGGAGDTAPDEVEELFDRKTRAEPADAARPRQAGEPVGQR